MHPLPYSNYDGICAKDEESYELLVKEATSSFMSCQSRGTGFSCEPGDCRQSERTDFVYGTEYIEPIAEDLRCLSVEGV
jgi:hypothetical protein